MEVRLKISLLGIDISGTPDEISSEVTKICDIHNVTMNEEIETEILIELITGEFKTDSVMPAWILKSPSEIEKLLKLMTEIFKRIAESSISKN